jgi:cyclic pyranopterin phosphate synthase
MQLIDGHGRQFPYLRLSLTDACNFRCDYCLPSGWQPVAGAAPELSRAELRRLAAGFAALGTRKIRLTGGEPTLRRDIDGVIADIAATPGIRTLALTTNGYRLARHAARWHAAGLQAVNVSVDSLDRARFHAITGHDSLPQVLRGIDACLDAGYRAVKVNTVLLRGRNDDELPAFLQLVRERPVSVRFIELMETGDRRTFFRDHHLSGAVVREQLLADGWVPVVRSADAGPAQEFTHPEHAGRIGLIMPYARNFCAACNRLRVSSRGALRLCLFGDDDGISLRHLLQHDAQQEELAARIHALLAGKQAGHRLAEGVVGNTRHLANIGG